MRISLRSVSRAQQGRLEQSCGLCTAQSAQSSGCGEDADIEPHSLQRATNHLPPHAAERALFSDSFSHKGETFHGVELELYQFIFLDRIPFHCEELPFF